MKYQRTTVETIEVVCVYDPEKGKEQHLYLCPSDDGGWYLSGPSDGIPLQGGDWIVAARGRKRTESAGDFRLIIYYYIIPVAEQDGWEKVEDE